MIRLTIPSIEEEELAAVREVLVSGYLVQGSVVAAFEHAVAAYVGTRYAVAVSNCTAALHLSLLVLDVRPGDLVIVTAYSYPATANVVEICGAQPVFVDIKSDTFNLDPQRLEERLNGLMGHGETARRVRAIIPVHTFGQPADMPAIMKISKQYGVPVIEDAACALGAKSHEHQAGTWGATGCFSFHPRKAITTGEGGIITTNRSDLAKRLRALRNHGQDPDSLVPDFIMPGFNYRLTEFQAALGLVQMTKLDRIIETRRRLATMYEALLASTAIEPPRIRTGCHPAYQSYVTLLPENMAMHRPEIIDRLKEMGIEATIGTWHLPLTSYFRARYGYQPGEFKVTDQVFSRALTLPLHERLSSGEQEKVIQQLKALTFRWK